MEPINKQIPTNWHPSYRVYEKAESIGMDRDWIQAQRLKFIELTRDKGQSLNQHFMNWLRKAHSKKPAIKVKRPEPKELVFDKVERADIKTVESYRAKIKQSLK